MFKIKTISLLSLCCLFAVSCFAVESEDPARRNYVYDDVIAGYENPKWRVSGADVVPGKSIDNLRLGSTRKQIWAVMGTTSSTLVTKQGLKEDSWFSRPMQVNVIYQNDKSIQIKISRGNLIAPGKIKNYDTFAKWRGKLSLLKRIKYREGELGHHSQKDTPMIPVEYYDDVKAGIAFRVIKAPKGPYINGIVVHRPGYVVLPESTGKLVDDTSFTLTKKTNSTNSTNSRMTKQQKENARKALSLLVYMNSAVRNSTNFYSFSEQYSTVKTQVDIYLQRLPKSVIKSKLQLAMDEYRLAHTGWQDWISRGGSKVNTGTPEFDKYIAESMFKMKVTDRFNRAAGYTAEAVKLSQTLGIISG